MPSRLLHQASGFYQKVVEPCDLVLCIVVPRMFRQAEFLREMLDEVQGREDGPRPELYAAMHGALAALQSLLLWPFSCVSVLQRGDVDRGIKFMGAGRAGQYQCRMLSRRIQRVKGMELPRSGCWQSSSAAKLPPSPGPTLCLPQVPLLVTASC